MEMDDSEIIGLVLRGNPDAFGAIVNRYHGDCFRFARTVLGNPQDAEDAVQEAFVRAYRALGRYREEDRFRHWLFRILVNQCRTAGARRGRRARREIEDPELVEGAAAADGEARQDRWADLERALAHLNPEQREAMVLKFGEGLEYSEIAQLTGTSVPALKMRVARAKESLRRFVDKAENCGPQARRKA